MQDFFAVKGPSFPKRRSKNCSKEPITIAQKVSAADIEDTMENAKIQFEAKKLKKLPDLKQHVDNSFVENAEKATPPSQPKSLTVNKS